MDLHEAMSTQRQIRRLKPDHVGDDVLLKIVEMATKAPNAQNKQLWEFVIVRDVRVKRALGKQNMRLWRLYRPFERGPAEQKKISRSVTKQAKSFESIPVLIVVCMRGRSWPLGRLYRVSRYASIMPAVQNLLLAARAEGLGAGLTTMPLWNTFATRRILGLPANVEPVVLIPVGWPEGKYGPNTRKPVAEVVHVDRFGNRPFL